MFGFSKKERAAEALRRGTKAALVGGFLHQTQIESLNLNPEASAWIYTDGLVHQLFALGILYSNSSISEESWATAKFFDNAVAEALTEYERANNLNPYSICSLVFSRLNEFSRINRIELAAGKHYLDTANKAFEKDSGANIKQICQLLRSATESYFQAAKQMFN